MGVYKEIVRPFLDTRDSETWHIRAREALHLAEIAPFTLRLLELFSENHKRFADDRLKVVMGGIEFENPLVAGAGWDKAGRAVKGLHALGFAGVEVGSVLFLPQDGNPKPRQFMVTPGVAINNLGFNTPIGGLEEVSKNLSRYKESGIPIGVNIGKNRIVGNEDAPDAYAFVANDLYDIASYFVINVSSPNTLGLRSLQDKGPLTDIVQAVNSAMEVKGKRRPLFVKISPDLTNHAVNDVIRVVKDNNLTGIIATNTTTDFNIREKYGERWQNQPGGLSGDDSDFRKLATEKVAHIYKETGGRIEIIGVGGVHDRDTALEKIRAGAKVVQIVTAIRGEGPAVAGKINRGIADFMDNTGIKSLDEIRGIAA